MKVLVTGGGGFLGLHIVKLLKSKNYDVTSLSRHHYAELDALEVETLKVDLTQKEQVDQCDLSSFDAIFHVAAMAGVWGKYETYHAINYEGTVNLFNKAKQSGSKYFIYTSTPSVVFGKDHIEWGDESLPYPEKFLTAYAETKSKAEAYVLEHATDELQALAIRPHLIWGPGDPHILPRLKQKAKAGKLKRVGSGENLVDIIYVENAARAHVDALEALMSNTNINKQAYFIGQEKPVNLWDFINTLLTKSELDPVEDSVSFDTAYRVGFILEKAFSFIGINKPEPPMTRFVATQLAKSHYFKHDKAKADFGYSPHVSIEEGLERTFAKDMNTYTSS